MPRRRRHGEEANLDRWLVSYADFITLLFAFFVVMYSISSVNEGKYRVLSDTLGNAFSKDDKKKPPPDVKKEEENITKDPSVTGTLPEQGGDQLIERILSQQERDRLVSIANKLEGSLAQQINDDMVTVNRTDEFISIEINSKLLFSSASAELEYEGLPVLTRIARILSGFPNHVQVEGYTDNIPIQNYIFPSNWELSASRAASVVNYFTELGVDPVRMAAIGYGEFRPVAENDTPAGRARNRRVSLVIVGKKDAIRVIDTSQEGVPSAATGGV